MIKAGTVFAGRYGILEKIGTGGMADVYKAQDTKLNRLVAIKVLKPELAEDEEFVHRFRIEGRAAAGLNNSNIISVYDVGNLGSTYYIVMELINGITLKEYIHRKGTLTARETMAIAAQVCVGLRAAHSHHIIHRDIKPQNIILSRDGKVKVTDFGIARAITDETKTMTNTAMGSVHYIAPEQAKGLLSDERSDIYSLGIVMYEMITGQVPFNKDTSIAVALAHMNETMVPPSKLNAECPIALEQIIFRCTQKSRERRYHNCTALLKDLKIAVNDPDYNFEKQEQENLMKSNTLVFSKEEVNTIRQGKSSGTAAETAVSGKQTAADSAVMKTTAENVPEADTRVKKTEIRQAESRKASSGAAGNNPSADTARSAEGVRKAGRPAVKQEPEKNAKKKKPLPKTLADRILFIASIVMAAACACLVIYIVASLSGCTQRKSSSSQKKTTTTETTTVDDTVQLETFAKNDFDPETQTYVPNVIGMSIKAAIQALQDAELDYKISVNSLYSDEYKVGVICEQSYYEGTIVLKGSTIVIYMSQGSDKFEIKEEYIGGSVSTFKNAVSQYADAFTVNYVKQNSDTVAANCIISITPSSGYVKSGDTVTVVYSAGPETVSVPSLYGYSKSEAASLLSNSGLVLGNVSYVNDNTIEKDCVISQQYEAGTALKNGSSVDVVLSDGPQLVTIPSDIIGKNASEAVYELEALGLTVQTVEQISDQSAGIVIGCDQEAEAQVASNTVVTLTISKEEETSEETETETESENSSEAGSETETAAESTSETAAESTTETVTETESTVETSSEDTPAADSAPAEG